MSYRNGICDIDGCDKPHSYGVLIRYQDPLNFLLLCTMQINACNTHAILLGTPILTEIWADNTRVHSVVMMHPHPEVTP